MRVAAKTPERNATPISVAQTLEQSLALYAPLELGASFARSRQSYVLALIPYNWTQIFVVLLLLVMQQMRMAFN